MVPIKHEVANGDTVQVLTSKSQTPHSDWLGIARTSKAQARIRAWIKAQQRVKSVELGAQLLERALTAEGTTLLHTIYRLHAIYVIVLRST
jgi:GTP pyrophosphokinase